MRIIRGTNINLKEVADDFYDAYERCYSVDINNRICAIPAFVNGLFACELYLKYMIGDKAKGIHNLKILFSLLEDKKRKELESIDSKYDLNELLNTIGDGFINWRYIFEDDNEEFGKGMPFLYTDYFIKKYLPIFKNMVYKM